MNLDHEASGPYQINLLFNYFYYNINTYIYNHIFKALIK